jgi:nucleotide-binding universal stress UspA family protein
LLVPAKVDPAPASIDNLLVALDGSPQAERIVPIAVALARSLAAQIVLAHVVPDARTLSPGAPEEAAPLQASYRRWLDGYLDGWQGRVSDAGTRVDVQTVEHEDVAEGLTVCAGAHPSTMVAITTHGRGGIAHWPFGSVAHRLIRTASVPMLLLRVTEG